MAEVAFCCQYCQFFCNSWKELLRHTFQSHSSLPGFRHVSQVNGCLQAFKNYSSMLSHLSRIHGGLSNLSNCSISGVEPHSSLSSEYEIESNETVEDSDDEVYGNICNDTDDDLQADVLEDSLIQNRAQDHVENIVLSDKVAALFLLNLKQRQCYTRMY